MEEIIIPQKYIGDNMQDEKYMFHYTSPEALLNILENNTIRFTNCLFLNDIKEYNYAVEVISDFIENADYDAQFKELVKETIVQIDKKNLSSFIEVSGRKVSIGYGEYYVLCGSLKQDYLPMWNYYVKGNNYLGYNFKISIENIVKSLNNVRGKILHGKIVYEMEEQKEIIKNYFAQAYQTWKEKVAKNLGASITTIKILRAQCINNIINFIQDIRVFFKDAGFSHEKEYRIALFYNSKSSNSTTQQGEIKKGEIAEISKGYSIKNGVISPHLNVKFPVLPIEEICSSPTIEKELAKLGLKDWLQSANLKVELKESKIKVRY